MKTHKKTLLLTAPDGSQMIKAPDLILTVAVILLYVALLASLVGLVNVAVSAAITVLLLVIEVCFIA